MFHLFLKTGAFTFHTSFRKSCVAAGNASKSCRKSCKTSHNSGAMAYDLMSCDPPGPDIVPSSLMMGLLVSTVIVVNILLIMVNVDGYYMVNDG